MPKNKSKRGWFGDSAGHATAGRKGGRARSRNQEIKAHTDTRAIEDRREEFKDEIDL